MIFIVYLFYSMITEAVIKSGMGEEGIWEM